MTTHLSCNTCGSGYYSIYHNDGHLTAKCKGCKSTSNLQEVSKLLKEQEAQWDEIKRCNE